MLKLTEKKEKIDIYGTVHELKKPTWDQIESLEKKTNDEPEKGREILKSFLGALGLPGEVFDKMPPADTSAVMQYLSGAGKK